jgi:hypothetical protein
MICFVIVANRLQVFSIIGCARNFRSACSISGNGMADFVTNVTVILIQILIAYAGAVIGWNLITNAIWISKFSKSSCLHLQPGHSDNSCGLANVGLCCLQSALPLAIGMLLCLLWANGHRLAWFEGHINPGFLDFLKNYVYSLLIALFGLACAQVFLPVMSLHKRMQDYKREHDREYSKLVRSQYEISLHTLPTSDEQKIKYLSDRLKVIQFLDPVALRLGTWPFDRAALVSYGISPVLTLVAALLKKLS